MGALWNRSGTIERDFNDIRAAAAQARFFQGGTQTPLVVYQDAAQTSPHPNPVLADSRGRWPSVFIPFIVGYDVQVKDSFGTQLYFYTNIPNPDPVAVNVTIPPEERVQTGMIIFELVQGVRTGYVRLNGKTIGNAVSGATERANADCSNLFTYAWNAWQDILAPVSGGRGGSAAADFAANKTLTLPDMRGSGFTGLDDMGAVAAGRFVGLPFGGGGTTVPASFLSTNSFSLTIADIPSHTHPIGITSGGQSADHVHRVVGNTQDSTTDHFHSGPTGPGGNHVPAGTISIETDHGNIGLSINDPQHAHSITDVTHVHNVRYNVVAVTPGSGVNVVAQIVGDGGIVGSPPAALANGTGLSTTNANSTGITSSVNIDGIVPHMGMTFHGTGVLDHTHPFTTSIQSANHAHFIDFLSQGISVGHTHDVSGNTGPAGGGGTTLPRVGRTFLGTYYIKL